MTIATNPAGIGVDKVYGVRSNYEGTEGRAAGVAGTRRQATLEFNGDQFDYPTVDIPSGAIVKAAYAVKVEAASAVGNADNTLEVGVDGSEGTNTAVSIGSLTTTGSVEGTLAGTLASPLTSDATIGVAVDGTSASVTGGKFRVFIEYEYAGDLNGL